MRRFFPALAALCLGVLAGPTDATPVLIEDFDSLTPGTTLADDGWVSTEVGGVPNLAASRMIVTAATPSDVGNSTGNYVDADNPDLVGGDNRVRKAFSAPTGFADTTQHVYYSFLARAREVGGKSWGPQIRLQSEIDASPSEFGPSFGVKLDSSVPVFVVSQAAFGTQFESDPGFTITYGEWYEIRLQIEQDPADVTNEKGSLVVRNVTDGETLYTPVPGLQSLDLRLNDQRKASLFDVWELDGNRFGQDLDDLTAGEGEAALIPEPGTMLLVGLGGLGVMRRRVTR